MKNIRNIRKVRMAQSEKSRWNHVVLFFVLALFITINSRAQQKGMKTKTPTGLSDNAYRLMVEQWKQGIDFYALGNEPSWSLNMDFNGIFHFNTLNGLDFKAPASPGDLAMDAEVIRFRSVTDSGEIIIELAHEKCSDTMSDDTFRFKVKVDFKGTGQSDYETFHGCGNYVPDFRINDIWAIVELNGEKLVPKDFEKGIPRMEFHIKEEAVMGSDGCNNFRGGFEVQGSSLIFTMLAGTRMFCLNMEMSDQITGAISGKKLWYKFDTDGYLRLLKDNKTVMKLRHID